MINALLCTTPERRDLLSLAAKELRIGRSPFTDDWLNEHAVQFDDMVWLFQVLSQAASSIVLLTHEPKP